MKKRLLSLLLVIVMVLGLVPVSAMANGADNVYISISRDGEFVNPGGEYLAYVPVKLSDLQAIDLDQYGLSEYKYDADQDEDYEVTALHLLIYAHEALYGGEWSAVRFSGSPGSSFIEGGLFGWSDCNLQYRHNGVYPLPPEGTSGLTSDQIVLTGGDYLDIAHFSSWSFYSDANAGFNYFTKDGAITYEYSVGANEPLTVTLCRSVSVMGSRDTVLEARTEENYHDSEFYPLPIYYGETLYADGATTAEIDGNGQATITFQEAGTYYLWADGGYGAAPDEMLAEYAVVSSPAYAKVTVTGSVQPEPEPEPDPVYYTVTCPSDAGYTVTGDADVAENEDYRFTVTVNNGYDGSNMVVKVNNEVISGSDGIYVVENVTSNLTISVEGVVAAEPEQPAYPVTVTAPIGSTVSVGTLKNYFVYTFAEPLEIQENETEGTVTYGFPVPNFGGNSFVRVQHPEAVTYWDYTEMAEGTVINITEEMLFIGNTEYTKDTVFANYEKNGHDTASLYLTANAQGWLDMDTGDTHSLNVFRNWIPVSNSTSNTGVSLPDVTYTVVDVNGNASDVVTVTPDANNSCYADIKAEKAGTAIILVTYDAVYNADGEGGKQFSAIWPENTGVIIVTVGAESGIETNMTVNEEANAGGKQILDVEHDILFYVGDAGAEYSFMPEDGCTVTVARSTVDDDMSFNGFTAEGVTAAQDGTVTVSGLTTGAHIIKVEKGGKVAYQTIRARQVRYALTHSDNSEVTAQNPAQPGETITVQFSGLIDPMGKLSGVYNAMYGFRYTGENGDVTTIESTSSFGEYYFGSNPARQRFSVTVPAGWSNATYTFTDGSLKLGGWGSTFGGHRSTTYMEGKETNTNASGTAGYAAVLPDVIIPVDAEPEVDTTLSTYIFNSEIDGTDWGRADAAYADKLSLFGAGVDDLRWDGDTCYVTLDKKTESNAGLGFLITYKANMDSWLDGLKATVNGESMTANEMLFTKLTNGTLTAEVYVTNNDIPSQSGTKTFVITVADETACDHEWTEANCTVPKTCKLCSVTRGDVAADGHNYVNGRCEYCGNYVGIEIVTKDTASSSQDIRISDFHINASGSVTANTISEDGRATVQVKAPFDELELTISMFGKKGMALSKAALAINDGDAVVPTSVDKENNVAVWIGTVTPEWNGNTAEIKFTVGYSSSVGFKNPKDYILTLEKVEEEPAAYTVTLPTEPVGYTVAANGESASPVTEGGSYRFTVTIADGYEKGENFAVKANGIKLTATEDVYTIENITADQIVTVEGVVEKLAEPTFTWQEIMAKTKSYLIGQAEATAPIVSSTEGEWMVLGLARNGVETDSDYFDAYYENVVEYVQENINTTNGRLHPQKSTDNSRVILALSALGKDVTDVGGHNLLQGLSDTVYVKNQGINGVVFALIALDSGDYEIPANSDSSRQVTREWLINYILEKQLPGGGWALSGQIPDDMTPMAIQALAPYYETNTDVRAAVDKALTVMQTMTATTETYAQMIVALSALGIDCEIDERFVDVMDNMLAFALEDGSFEKGAGSGSNQMSTEQAFYALVAYNRFKNGQTGLYDMTDVVTKEQKYTITIAATENGTVTASAEQAIAGAKIALTVEPAIGYELKSLAVKDAANNAVDVANNKFTMPASNVTVTAEFAKTEDPAQDVIEAIDALTVTKADRATQEMIAEIKAAYDALSVEDQDKVTNYSDLEAAVAAFNRLLNTAKTEAQKELEATFDELKEEDYTEENWQKIQTLRNQSLAAVEQAKNTDEINAIVKQAKDDLKKIAAGGQLTVTFRLIGDGKHDNGVTDHEEYVTWIPTTTYKLKPGATMYDVFVKAIADYGLSQTGAANGYVESIKAPSCLGGYWLGEFDNGQNSGWMYTVNGDHPGTGLTTFDLTDGDRIIWHYVDDYIQEERTNSSKYYYRWLEAKDIAPETYVKEKVGKILTVGEHGKVEPAEIKLSDIGKDITFTFKPDTGYVVKDVIIDGESKGSITTYTYKNLRYDSRIEVKFAKAGELFNDVKTSDWFYDDVMFVVEEGLFNGTGDNKFSPNASMNRAMLVTVLYRLEGEPKVTGSSEFDDVAGGQWYTDAVIWATQNEIVNGYGNGKFGPTDNITREQMATILFRYAQFKKHDTSASNSLTGYSDFNDISVFSLKALKWANAEGLINGRTATTLSPKGTATRAEVAAILHRFVENVVNR